MNSTGSEEAGRSPSQYCRFCGSQLADHSAAFCGSCGRPLATPSPVPTRKPGSVSPLRVAMWVAGLGLAGFFVILVVGSIALVFDDSTEKGKDGGSSAALLLLPGRDQPVEVKEAVAGPAGGVFQLADGAAVTVPRGALSSDAPLRIERIEPGIENFGFTVGSSVIYRVSLGGEGVERVSPPVTLDIPWAPDRTMVLSFEDGEWVPLPLVAGEMVRVELDHFSTRTVLALGASFASGLRTVVEGVANAVPRWDLRDEIQQKEADHRKRIEAMALSTRQFYGVGETTKRPHAAICEEFKTVLQANTSTLTFNMPPDAPNVYYLSKHLGDAGRPSAGDSTEAWFWSATAGSHAAIREQVLAAASSNQVSPAVVLQIAIRANGGSVPLGILAAHNILKEVAYSGREIGDPSETYVNRLQDIPPADGRFVASIETWRKQSDHSPIGRYDKMGPLYHIFAAMTARVWGGESLAQAALSAETLLRSFGWGPDIPDPEKGAADECGRDIGDWILDFVSIGFEPVTGKVEVGKEVPLTLTVRNLSEKGVSVDLRVIEGGGSLSRSAVSVSKGSPTALCDISGTTAYCGFTFTPSKSGESVIEARAGKLSATVKVGGEVCTRTPPSPALIGANASREVRLNEASFCFPPNGGDVTGKITVDFATQDTFQWNNGPIEVDCSYFVRWELIFKGTFTPPGTLAGQIDVTITRDVASLVGPRCDGYRATPVSSQPAIGQWAGTFEGNRIVITSNGQQLYEGKVE